MMDRPVKTPEQKAAESSASKAWPERNDPLYKKLYSIQWMSHREGFLAGVEWEKKRAEKMKKALERVVRETKQTPALTDGAIQQVRNSLEDLLTGTNE